MRRHKTGRVSNISLIFHRDTILKYYLGFIRWNKMIFKLVSNVYCYWFYQKLCTCTCSSQYLLSGETERIDLGDERPAEVDQVAVSIGEVWNTVLQAEAGLDVHGGGRMEVWCLFEETEAGLGVLCSVWCYSQPVVWDMEKERHRECLDLWFFLLYW